MKRLILGLFLTLAFSLQLFSADNDPTLKRVILDNGLTVILKEKHDVPMVSMQMWVKAGSITEGKQMGTGLSHYFEHMLFKETDKRGIEEFANDIRRAGGSDLNAYTTFDRTVYHFTIRSEYFDLGVEALADIMQNAKFSDEESKKEAQVILKEINMGDDDPDRVLSKLLFRTAYKVHPYRHPVIGYRHLFESLTKQDILDYYHTMYSPNNMILVVVGDFKMDDALETIKKEYKDFKRKKLPSIYIPEEPKQIGKRVVVQEFAVKVTKMAMSYHTVDALSEDVAPLDVLALIVGSGKTSRLYKKLKEEQQIVQSIGVYSWTPKYAGIFEVFAEFEQKNFNQVLKSIKTEIEQIKEKGIDADELERAKRKVQFSAIKGLESYKGYASELASGEFIGDMNYPQRYLEAINKVTNEDIIRVANKYLNESNQTIVALVPKKEVAKIDNDNKSSDLKPGKVEKIVRKNGATLLLKKDKSVPMVAINAIFDGGYSYENKSNQGLFNLWDHTLFKGTKTKSAEEIAKIIENTGGYLYSNYDRNFLSIRGNFLKGDFNQGFDLFLDILSNANFPQNEIDKEKKVILADIKKRDEDIGSASIYHLRRVRFKDHPYSSDGLGTNETIKKLKQKDLLKAYKNYVAPNNMVIAIFGDIDKKEIIKKLEKKSLFNSRKSRLKKSKKVAPITKKIKDTYYYTKEEKRQSLVRLLFDGPEYHSDDYYPMTLLTHVFSGIGSRLFNDLRGKRTLAYSTGGYYYSMKNYGLFMFYILTEPAKKEEAIKGLFEHVAKIKTELITEKELEIAKNSTIGPIIKQLQTLTGQASMSASNEKLKLGYDYHLKFMEEVNKVTREDIQRVAKKYFTEDKYVLTIVESEMAKKTQP